MQVGKSGEDCGGAPEAHTLTPMIARLQRMPANWQLRDGKNLRRTKESLLGVLHQENGALNMAKISDRYSLYGPIQVNDYVTLPLFPLIHRPRLDQTVPALCNLCSIPLRTGCFPANADKYVLKSKDFSGFFYDNTYGLVFVSQKNEVVWRSTDDLERLLAGTGLACLALESSMAFGPIKTVRERATPDKRGHCSLWAMWPFPGEAAKSIDGPGSI